MKRTAGKIIVFLFLFQSCIPQIDEAALLYVKDIVSPVITISSPADGSAYASSVVVAGTVEDYADESGSPGGIESISWEILGTDIKGVIDSSESGSFSFQFATRQLSGTLVVRVSALDWNGNTAEKSITLINAGNDIPSFSAQPGNRSVTLSWDPVALSTGYVLYYTTNGNYPSESYGIQLADVESPLVLSNLVNGSLCTFLLEAESSGGENNMSGYIQAIPLTGRTLAPRVSGEYKRIRIEWPEIDSREGYVVMRSTSPDSGFSDCSGILTGNSFYDTEVGTGTKYYYKILPAMYRNDQEKASYAVSGEASPFAGTKNRKATYQPISGTSTISIAKQGNLVYALSTMSGSAVYIFDFSNPDMPVLEGSVGTSSTYNCDIGVSGNYAYVLDNMNGSATDKLNVYNVSNPDAPQFFSSCTYESNTGVTDVLYIDGTNAYVATGDNRIYSIDISSPGSLTNYTLANDGAAISGAAQQLAADDSYIYAASGTAAIEYFSKTDVHAGVVGTIPLGSAAYGIRITGSTLFVSRTGTPPQFDIYDISTPSTPVLESSIDTTGSGKLDVSGDFAVIAEGTGGVEIINTADTASPYTIGVSDTPGDVRKVVKDGHYIYAADWSAGINVLDVNLPSPKEAGQISTTNAWGVSYENSTLMVADGTSKFRFFSIGADHSVLPLTTIGAPSSGTGNGCFLLGDYAYGADDSGGLAVYRLAGGVNPSSAEFVSVKKTAKAYDAAVQGDFAFVADYNDKFLVFDIADPASVTLIGSYFTPGSSYGIDVLDRYAYIAAYTAGLVIMDISDPLAPALAGVTSGITATNDVMVKGSYAYLADGANGLRIIDVSDPGVPVLVSTTDTIGTAEGVFVEGDYAYIADYTSGISVIDISEPASPGIIGKLDISTTGICRDIRICGAYGFAANGTEGVEIINFLPSED